MRDRPRRVNDLGPVTYTRQVRRFAAVLMLVVFASLNAIDGICCPDGCTHEEQASSWPSSASADGVCVLCTGGLQGPVLEHLAPSAIVRSDITRIAVMDPHDVAPDPPEHPPRS